MMDDTRPPEIQYDPIRWKAGLLIMLFASAFAVIVGRLFWIQVVEASRYRELARRQYESKVPLRAQRGMVYDRNMREVATMIKTTSFAADPTLIRNVNYLAELLSIAHGESPDTYKQKITSAKSRFAWLARGVNTTMYPVLDTIRDPGLIRLKEPKRHFVYGPVAAQVIGTTNIDNDGLTGLELAYDSLLKGQSGFVVMQRDGRGRLRPGVNPEREAPKDGMSLQLTIDIDMQRIVEQELMRGVTENRASGGTVVAVDPATGDILAMASYPTFDPNRLDRASPDAIRIRAITDQYEPGSTMKAITAAALLEERKLAPNDKVDGGNGVLNMNGHIVKDDHPVGQTTFRRALEQSSNVVFANSAKLLDDRVYYKYVRDFGFGIPSGVDIPGEVRGMLKRPDAFDATTKMFMAFGYELSATALQMVTAYATIANGGEMMQPHCVKALIKTDGSIAHEWLPQKVRRVISEQSAHLLTNMLVGVVENGTGQEARIGGVRIAGKTGTAQQIVEGKYSQAAYTASFVGYYPADAPRVAMIVMLDRPLNSIYGGSTAAPIFKRIVQKTMTMLALDERTVASIAASAEADTVVVPDLRGLLLASADTVVQRLGLRLADSTYGTGVVIRQTPAPGIRVERRTAVRIETQVQQGTTSNAGTPRPDVIGFPLRRAVTVLHAAGYDVRVRGTGRVKHQAWNGKYCTLTASDH